MIKISRLKTKIYILLLLVLLCISGCQGDKKDSDTRSFSHSLSGGKEEVKSESTEVAEGKKNDEGAYRNQYLILSVNSAKENMKVYRYANGVEYQYYYGMMTEFCNKYGDYTAVANFSAGDIVNLSGNDQDGKVGRVEKSDLVWVYDDVQKFTINDEGNILTIGDTKYQIDDETFIFSGNDIIEPDKISQNDKLTVVGFDKKILSINVTTGHGFLKLKNTELFEGSFMQLSKDIFTVVTKDMEMELPEGKYKLTVANNGWGGSKDIKIKRGKTLEVDLDQIKGKGPKKAKILFEVDVDTARIFIDNEEIDYSQPIELVYGQHSLIVMAEGYTTWKKTLYVNSKEATIIITLTDSETGEKPKDSQKEEPGESQNSSENKDSENSSESNKTSEKADDTEKKDSKKVSEDMLKDYLSTITELLNSIN